MARGNRREAIFVDEEDRKFFLKCLSEACEKTGWLVHAWVLMGNHYHLFLETPEANLVEGMKWLQNTVTRRFNVRHREWGRLFGDRYKAVLVDGDSGHYYTTLWEYLHLNPCRAGLVKAENGESLLDYPWSSLAGGYALMPGRRPKWLAAEKGLKIMGYPDTAIGRHDLVDHLDQRAANERTASGIATPEEGTDGRISHLRRGWYWGRQEFAEKALKLAAKAIRKPRAARAYRTCPERIAHGEIEAGKLLAAGLLAAGIGKGELRKLPANEPRKVMLAALLWKKTTVRQAWIARKLEMRNAANVSLAIHRADWKRLSKQVPPRLRAFYRKCKNMHTDPQLDRQA
jgi:REP element-mobilizing transposase RayT